MVMNNRPSPFKGISIRGSNQVKTLNSIYDQHTAQPQSAGDYIQSELRMGILEGIQNEFANSSCCISPATSEVNQVVLEDECTKILNRLVDYCNSRYLKNFHYRLMMEVYED